ncbi:hypothetical protein [Methylobacterium sp. SyP6R]|uniref:hypothetical protein n=1 Tax=Methylobacterium sp. SyP6R TaxID=2718876 RepID=UPI001F242B38|nr:hypothetical protein [Methylobacterium sp. SyP6R]MCF4123813.1 hypothetical protein [Methylobacterium sp. SyP6R]
MNDSENLKAAIDRAVRLAHEWSGQPKPNEPIESWDIDAIDDAVRKIKILSNIGQDQIIETVTYISEAIKLPEISYLDSTKEVVAMKARAGALSQALWEVGKTAHETAAGTSNILTISPKDKKFADLVEELSNSITQATDRILELENMINENPVESNALPMISATADVGYLKQKLQLASELIKSSVKVSVKYIQGILSSARDNAENILSLVGGWLTSFGLKIKKISLGIASATTKAFKSGVALAKRLLLGADEVHSPPATDTVRLEQGVPFSFSISQSELQEEMLTKIVAEIIRITKSKNLVGIYIDKFEILGSEKDNGTGVISMTIYKADEYREWGSRGVICSVSLKKEQYIVFEQLEFQTKVKAKVALYIAQGDVGKT